VSNVQLQHDQVARSGVLHPVRLVLPDLEGPLNVGSVFRIADALGVERVYLTGRSATPPDPKIRRTSRSTEKSVAYEYRDDVRSLLDELRGEGYAIVSLELTSGSTDIRRHDWPPDGRVALILGSENHGVSQELLDASDHTVHIPMAGQNSSMNVAMACAIALFELLRERLR